MQYPAVYVRFTRKILLSGTLFYFRYQKDDISSFSKFSFSCSSAFQQGKIVLNSFMIFAAEHMNGYHFHSMSLEEVNCI